MGDIRQIVRRESNSCPWLDFVQRLRLGLIGALLIFIATALYRCLF